MSVKTQIYLSNIQGVGVCTNVGEEWEVYYKCWISPLEQNPAQKCELQPPN